MIYKNYRNVVEIDFLFSNENTIWEQGVAGSNPATPTKFGYPCIFFIISIMKTNLTQDERIAKITFASVYPHYITKVTKNERTVEELHTVIEWLTGMNKVAIQQAISDQLSFKDFFAKCTLNENAVLITGSICGYKVEEIENSLTRKVRMLDKLVDELAKGKNLEKILR